VQKQEVMIMNDIDSNLDEVVTVCWKAVTPSFNIETNSLTEI